MVHRNSSIQPQIDTSPPILFVDNILRSTKLVHDIGRQRQVAKDNKELLKRINRINRTQGFLGVKYDYKPKAFVNWEAREQETKRIQRANLVLLERILDVPAEIKASEQEKSYRNLIKYRKICARHNEKKMELEKKTDNICGCPSIKMIFCERKDRRLGCLKINLIKSNVFDYLLNEGIQHIRGSVYRIYKCQYIVIRGHVSTSDNDKEQKKQLIEHVQRGSLLRAIINDQPAFLLTLISFERLANCQLLGVVDPPCSELLNLLNYYGTAYGRTLEPLCFRIEIKPQN